MQSDNLCVAPILSVLCMPTLKSHLYIFTLQIAMTLQAYHDHEIVPIWAGEVRKYVKSGRNEEAKSKTVFFSSFGLILAFVLLLRKRRNVWRRLDHMRSRLYFRFIVMLWIT